MAAAIVAINFKPLALSGENPQEMKEKMNINVIVSFDVKMDKIAEFSKILENVKSDLPKVEGCVSVDIFKSSASPNKFTLVETWETKKSHQAHIDSLSKNGTWDIIASHLTKDPESDYFIQF